MQQQLCSFDSVKQRIFHRQSAARTFAHVRAVQDQAIAAARLGLVHGGIRILQQHLRSGARIRRQAQSYGSGDVQSLTVDDKRFLERRQTPLRNRKRDPGILESRQEQHEFVATPSRERVALADTRLERGPDQFEQCVAHPVA